MTINAIAIELSSPQIGTIRYELPVNAQADAVVCALRSAIGLFSVVYDSGERAQFLRELGSDITVLAHEVEQ